MDRVYGSVLRLVRLVSWVGILVFVVIPVLMPNPNIPRLLVPVFLLPVPMPLNNPV